jgi:hypothetical protein
MYTTFFRGGYPSLVTHSPKKIKHKINQYKTYFIMNHRCVNTKAYNHNTIQVKLWDSTFI